MPVIVWINAFIPANVPGYTKLISTGANAGKTAVPLPSVARLNPLNTFKAWDAGYLTDQRTFSPVPSASCRMQSLAVVNTGPAPALLKQTHTSSGTTEVDTSRGLTLSTAVANMRNCRFFNFTVSAAKTVLTVDVEGSASDPLVSAAANITYEGTFTITLQPDGRTVVDFRGKIDVFPAFEAYAQVLGATKALFSSPPPPGNTVVDLAKHLGPTRPVAGSATF
jgi:hypothetical protein